MFKTIKVIRRLIRYNENTPSTKIFQNYPTSTMFLHISKRFSSSNNENFTSQGLKISGMDDSIDVSELTQNDPEVEKRLQVIALEADILRQESGRIPKLETLKAKHWRELLAKSSRSQRNKYFEFLFKLEKKIENRQTKKEQARIERETRPEYVDDGHIRYSLNYNTIFLRIYDSTVNHFYNSRLIRAIQFGQKIVIDCSYEKNMIPRECSNCAKQIMLLFAENRLNDDPFDLHLCNVDLNGGTIGALKSHIPTMLEPTFPLNVHEGSYLDLFPKEKLVYLTPHCREQLVEYDHDAVYILGGIVDKVNNEPLSLAKAKRDGLQMKKLPLDRFLQWGSGSGKSLTLNQCVSILLDVKNDGDWEHALRHVPRRKLFTKTDQSVSRNMKNIINRNTSLKRRDFVKTLLQS